MNIRNKDSISIEDEQPNKGDVELRPRRHPLTLENSPEETLRRMRALPERAAKLREMIRALRETNAR
jgi:hypothetical protein